MCAEYIAYTHSREKIYNMCICNREASIGVIHHIQKFSIAYIFFSICLGLFIITCMYCICVCLSLSLLPATK